MHELVEGVCSVESEDCHAAHDGARMELGEVEVCASCEGVFDIFVPVSESLVWDDSMTEAYFHLFSYDVAE